MLNQNKGFTLMEVLVAMLVLAIALLGLAKLQAFGMKNTGNAYYKTQATLVLNEAAELLRLNPGDSCPETPSTAPEWLGRNLAGISEILPSGKATVGRAVDSRGCTITIEWTESNVDPDGSGEIDAGERERSEKSVSMTVFR